MAGSTTRHTDWAPSVGFSSGGRQIVSSARDKLIRELDATTESLTTTTQVDFTDQSVLNEDGWICGNEHKLLMWIPPAHRAGLHRPSNIWVASENETRLDLSKFVHGHRWTSCIGS